MKALSFKTYFLALSLSLLGALPLWATSGEKPYNENDYDRLDGTGKSGLKVNVIEWEGNLELHSEPPGKLQGFSLKVDDSVQDKKVMVIGYRIQGQSRPLIRRAILSIPLSPKFNVYRDKSARDYDKYVITNQGLSAKEFLTFKTDPASNQLYPDEHPKVAQEQNNETRSKANTSPTHSGSRSPASVGTSSNTGGSLDSPADHSQGDGTIRPFGM
jgi:hypothetical protein